MSIGHYHELCNRYRGRAVEIRCHDGGIHRGMIERVSNNRVFLRPMGRSGNLGGFGYGFGGGYGWGVALGSIAALTLLPFFFW